MPQSHRERRGMDGGGPGVKPGGEPLRWFIYIYRVLLDNYLMFGAGTSTSTNRVQAARSLRPRDRSDFFDDMARA